MRVKRLSVVCSNHVEGKRLPKFGRLHHLVEFLADGTSRGLLGLSSGGSASLDYRDEKHQCESGSSEISSEHAEYSTSVGEEYHSVVFHMSRLGSRERSVVFALALTLGGGCDDPRRSDGPRALRVVVGQSPERLDPRFVADPQGLRVSRLLFASLVTIDPRSLEVVPDLAERIELESPVRYRVVLRPRLRFSDGSPLEAADVAATFRSVVDPVLGSRYARTYRRIAKMETPNKRTVIFHLDAPHATFLTDLELPILPRASRASPVDRGNGRLLGAGPYVLRARSRAALRLEANPHWHRGRPLFPAVEMIVVRDDKIRALRLLADEADLAVGAIPPLLLPLFEKDRRFRVDSVPGVATTYLGFQLESPRLRDVRVRRALAHAIDRRALVGAKLGGRGELASGWIVPGHWAYRADVDSFEHDPARARALLDAAGLRDPDGRGPAPRFTLSLLTTADRPRVSMARAIAAMLGRVGVKAEVRPREKATLLADLGAGRFEMALMEVPEVFEPHVLSWFFGSDRIPGGAGMHGANRWRYRSNIVDAELERGRAHPDRATRTEAYHRVQHWLARDLPVVPLWHDHVVAVANARARGFDVPRDGRLGTLAY